MRRHPHLTEKLTDPSQLPLFIKALHKAAVARARKLVRGIRLYQKHPFQRDEAAMAMPVIWERGTTRLLDYGSLLPATAPILLIIPSLINRYTILDLDKTHSFARYLTFRGIRPFVIDWAEPGDEEKGFTIEEYALQRLLPIHDFLKARFDKPVSVLGYCMGGLLALVVARLREVASLTLLATPWHTSLTTMGDVTNLSGQDFVQFAQKIRPILDKLSFMPVSLLQTLFAVLQPTYPLYKFLKFADERQESLKARTFVLTEDWLNDGIPLAAPVASELLGDIYGQNITGKLKWRISHEPMDPRLITVPTYVVVANKDKIVPPESSLPLARLIRGSALQQTELGHIGLMVSDRAPREVWKPFAHWILQQ